MSSSSRFVALWSPSDEYACASGPFGATGARQLLHLAHALRAAGGSIGLSTMCGGGGIATATVIESAD